MLEKILQIIRENKRMIEKISEHKTHDFYSMRIIGIIKTWKIEHA
jgi:hypothetical protein